jgi:hypothetical protein
MIKRGRPADPAQSLLRAAVQCADDVGDRVGPDDPRHDDDDGDGRRVADHLARRAARDAVDDRTHLQPDEDEQRGVEDEVEDLPDVEALQSRARGDDARTADAHVDARGHHREHPGHMELVGGDERCIPAEQRDRDAHLGVLGALADERDDPADGQPDRDPTDDRDEEAHHGVAQREAALDRRDDRHAVGHERGRIVEEPLGLD